MTPRGRQPDFVMGPEHRTKIGNSKILNHLIECAEGKRKMDSTRAQVALGLLKKVMPDLSSVTHSGDEERPIKHDVEIHIVRPNPGGSSGST